MAKLSGLTVGGVEWNIRELKKAGLLKRIGSDNGGKWEIS